MNTARLAAAAVLGLVVLAPALFAAAGGANGAGLSPPSPTRRPAW